ncbi:MAG: PucR family transcriptional regulator [Pseudonocardia sp.]
MRRPGTAIGSGEPAALTGDSAAYRRENALLRELVAAYSHLSALAAQDGGVDGAGSGVESGVAGVIALVARRTGAAVAVLGPGLEPLAAEPPDAARRVRRAVGAPLPTVLEAAADTRRPTAVPGLGPGEGPETVLVAPILVGDEVAAHLVTLTCGEAELGEDLALLLTEHAATICGLLLGRERVVAAAAGRARTDLVEGLLLGRDRDAAELDRWARHLGFVRGAPHHVLAARRTGSGPGAVLDIVERAVHRRLAGAIVAARETEVVAIVPGGPDVARALAEHCLAEVAQHHPAAAAVIGIGGACAEPAEIARSCAQARGAVDAAARMGAGARVVAFDDLGVHRLLFQVPDPGRLRTFAAEVLGALEGQPDLLDTLTVWFRCTTSPQRTARELEVHPNTVTYRLRRVEELTGLRLDDHRDRLMAQVACEILGVLG